jgi:hypothetical protein
MFLIAFSFFQDVVQKSHFAVNCAVAADKLGNIVIRIQAKPGAKQNAVTGLSLQNRLCTHFLMVYGAI